MGTLIIIAAIFVLFILGIMRSSGPKNFPVPDDIAPVRDDEIIELNRD